MRLLIFLLIIIIANLSIAQNSVIELEKSDSVKHNKILVVPLNPKLYFSDSDHILEEYNERTSDQIFYRWRSAIDINTTVYLMALNKVQSMLMDTSWDVTQDIKALYQSVTYGYETSSRARLEEEANGKKFFNKVKDKVSELSEKVTEDKSKINHPGAGELGEEKEKIDNEFKFMNVTMARPEMLQFYAEKYECDEFLFITQFELRTLYPTHADRWTNNYTRQIALHYAVYDQRSQLKYGDVVRVTFDSNSNDLETIIRNTLPFAAQKIAESIR
tara:strand:+ start:171 stop:992 length:822 start_codon:yes stop_codon:yes gene_type:complete